MGNGTLFSALYTADVTSLVSFLKYVQSLKISGRFPSSKQICGMRIVVLVPLLVLVCGSNPKPAIFLRPPVRPPLLADRTAARSLNETYSQLAASLTSESVAPGELVRSLLAFSVAQMDLFNAGLGETPELAAVRERFADGTLAVLEAATEGFKARTRQILASVSREELTDEVRAMRRANTEPTLNLGALVAATPGDEQHARLAASFEAVRAAVDTQPSPLTAYMTAYPMVKRLGDLVDDIRLAIASGEMRVVLRA